MTKQKEKIEDMAAKGAISIMKEIPGIYKELIRASISNPIVGIAVAVSAADLLRRAGLISQEAATIILVSVGAVEAAETASTLLSDLIPFKNSANELIPSAKTVVFGSGDKAIEGLIEGKK